MRHTIIAGAAVLAIAATTHANIRITEVMSSSGSTADWIEITNYGSTAVDLTGWRMDDGSFNFGVSVALTLPGSILGAGESAVFIESAGGAGIPLFQTFWGGNVPNVLIGYYSGSGVGFSSGGDGACLFDASGNILSQVSFGAATSGASFFYGWDALGNLDANYNGLVSTVGTIGTQVTTTSADALGNVGSLGSAIGVPAPGALALLGLAGLGARRRR